MATILSRPASRIPPIPFSRLSSFGNLLGSRHAFPWVGYLLLSPQPPPPRVSTPPISPSCRGGVRRPIASPPQRSQGPNVHYARKPDGQDPEITCHNRSFLPRSLAQLTNRMPESRSFGR